MNNFKGGNFRSGGNTFGGAKKHGGGQRRDNRPSGQAPELFSATCAECSKQCDVPFKPAHDKPVYCSACFGMKKSANEPRGSFNNENDRVERKPRNNERPDYTKLPRDQRPPRHDASRGRNDEGIADIKRQITNLEQKLNRILEIINPPMPSVKVPLPVKETAKTVVSKKTPATKADKKVTKKVAAKKTAKTTTKKATTKKTGKKATKKVSKK